MVRVRRHRRHVPGSWFRTTVVRTHYRRSPGGLSVLAIVAAIAVIVILIAVF